MEKDQRRGLDGHHVYLAVGEKEERYLYSLGSHHADLEDRMENKLGGFVIKSGELETASGHRFYALLEVCAPDSHEHYATGVVVPGLVRAPERDSRFLLRKGSVQSPSGEEEPLTAKVLWQGDPDFDAWVKQAREEDPSFEFFPYRYLYYDALARERDHHVGPDGWSRY